MGRDWNEPRDKTPLMDEYGRRQKKGGGKKPFAIESRFIGPIAFFNRDWYIHRRYKTEKQRDQALAHLQTKVAFGGHRLFVEYRKHEPDKPRE